ncbi:hypothetical protein LX36DRAFT_57544 [Colletotrichum falcatum]|nr:hypothetical protein LX36DRAFT_57544 [Colletotrichum falcatum]
MRLGTGWPWPHVLVIWQFRYRWPRVQPNDVIPGMARNSGSLPQMRRPASRASLPRRSGKIPTHGVSQTRLVRTTKQTRYLLCVHVPMPMGQLDSRLACVALLQYVDAANEPHSADFDERAAGWLKLVFVPHGKLAGGAVEQTKSRPTAGHGLPTGNPRLRPSGLDKGAREGRHSGCTPYRMQANVAAQKGKHEVEGKCIIG